MRPFNYILVAWGFFNPTSDCKVMAQLTCQSQIKAITQFGFTQYLLLNSPKQAAGFVEQEVDVSQIVCDMSHSHVFIERFSI